MLIGLIADTHGYLGDDVLQAFTGCDLILHAGDVGSGVISRLATVAPVTAVRGNNDTVGPEAALPLIETVDALGHRLTVVHRLVDVPPTEFDILVFGHCHKQHQYSSETRLFVNPGAAGRRGFHRTRSVALLRLETGNVNCQFLDLGPRKAAA